MIDLDRAMGGWRDMVDDPYVHVIRAMYPLDHEQIPQDILDAGRRGGPGMDCHDYEQLAALLLLETGQKEFNRWTIDVEYPVARAWAYWFAATLTPPVYEHVSKCEYVMLIEGLEALMPRAHGLPEHNRCREQLMTHCFGLTFRDGVYLRTTTTFGERDLRVYPDLDREKLTRQCSRLAKRGGFYEFDTGFDDRLGWWYARFYQS